MDSTNHAPPAGSLTRPMFDSSASTTWVLRAIRRVRTSGRPITVSSGNTVMNSAWPTAAAKAEMVPRSTLT